MLSIYHLLLSTLLQALRFFTLLQTPPCVVTEFCSRGSLYDVLQEANSSPELANRLTWPKRLAMVSWVLLGRDI